MKLKPGSIVHRFLNEESGQILPWIVILITLLFAGLSALVVDVGRAVVAYHMLQASSDAAALAGVQVMPTATANSTVTNMATLFSSVPGNKNASSLLPNAAMVTGYPKLYCSTTAAGWGVTCNPSLGASGANAIEVAQTLNLPMYFGAIIGVPTMTITATSTAAMQGSLNAPYNIAIVLDTTASMGSTDTDPLCNNTRIHCALQGIQDFLQLISPCTAASVSGTCVPFDTVGLFTFPNVQANQVSKDTSCPSSNPAIPNYYTPVPGATWSAPTGTSATYELTSGFLYDYTTTNSGGTVSSSSALGVATGASTCSGVQTPGGDGTYYAGAIYAAQSALMAASAANAGTQNAMIILSDGDASSTKITTSGTTQKAGSTLSVGSGSTSATYNFTVAYPSTSNQCQQAIDAARNATAQGTKVFTIAYGAANSGCSTDTSGPLKGLSPCTAMKDMATNLSYFFSDSTSSSNTGACISSSAAGAVGLDAIFTAAASKLTVARLMPNGTP